MDKGEDGLTAAAADEVVARLAGWLDRKERRRESQALLESELAGLAEHPRVVDAMAQAVHRFTAEELPEHREAVAAVLSGWGLVLSLAGLEEAAIATDDQLVRRFEAAAEPVLRRGVAWALFDRAAGRHSLGSHEQALSGFDEALRRVGEPVDEEGFRLTVHAMYNRGLCLEALDQDEEAVAAYDDVLRRLGDGQDDFRREQAVHALSQRGLVLARIGRHEAVLATLDELLRRAGPAEKGHLAAIVSGTLVDRAITLHLLGREDALVAAREALHRAERLGHNKAAAQALLTVGNRLRDAGRTDEALRVMRAIVERFGESDEWWAQLRVAGALVAIGWMLGGEGSPEEALTAYREVLRRVGERPSSPNTGQEAAEALAGIASLLRRSGRHTEAIAAADEAIARIDAWTDVLAPESMASVRYTRAEALADLDRWAEAREEYQALVARFADRPELRVRWCVAWALYTLGGAPGVPYDAAVAAWSEVERRFGDARDPELVEVVVSAMSRLAWMLDGQRRREEAVAVFDRLIERYAGDPAPVAQAAVAHAAVDRADRLGKLGRLQEELSGYEAVVARWGGASEPEVLAEVVRARHYQGVAFGRAGRSQEAVAAYRDALARSEAAGLAARHSTAWSLAQLVEMMSGLGRPAEALPACERYLGGLLEVGASGLDQPLAKALYWQAEALWRLQRHEEAIAACRRVVDRFGASQDAAVWTARAYEYMARSLCALDRPEEALAACEEVVARFGADARPGVRMRVNEAIAYAGGVLEGVGRSEEAVARYRSVIERLGEPATAADWRQLWMVVARLAALGAATVEEIVARLADSRDRDARQRLASVLATAAREQGGDITALTEAVRRARDGRTGNPAGAGLLMSSWGIALAGLGRWEEAAAAQGEAVRLLTEADDPALAASLAGAMLDRIGLFEKLGRVEEALAAADEFAHRFVGDDDEAVVEVVASAMRAAGRLLVKLGRADEGLARLDEVTHRFGDAAGAGARHEADRARLLQALLLGRGERWDEAERAYRDVANRLASTPDPRSRELAAQALTLLEMMLQRRARWGHALAVCDELLSRFGHAPEPDLRQHVARAARDRCRLLMYQDRIAESATAAADVVSRFRDDDDSRVRALVGDAMGLQLVDLVRLERYGEALVRAEESRNWFGDPSEPGLRVSLALVEMLRAVVVGAMGREAEAKQLLRETAARFAPDLTAHLDKLAALLETRPVSLRTLVGNVLRQYSMDRRGLLALRDDLAALAAADRPDEQLLERAQSLLTSLAMFMALGTE